MTEPLPVLDHGFVQLIDSMGTDHDVAAAARVSYAKFDITDTHKPREDKRLIRYLMRHDHGTPFEMIQTKWHIKAPLFVVAQWQRHRMGSFNQISARYRKLPEEFYVPDIADIRKQSTDNKQGRGELFDYDVAANLRTDIADEMIAAFDYYHEMIDGGVANEIARLVLPTATYTEFYWSVNMRALMNFLRLRMDAHAQLEIRLFAIAIASVVAVQWPLCWDAFSEYVLHAVTFSDREMGVLRDMAARTENYNYPDGTSDRDKEEFLAKLGK